jgi:hypothetical protein
MLEKSSGVDFGLPKRFNFDYLMTKKRNLPGDRERDRWREGVGISKPWRAGRSPV